ncbi:DNA polymerase III subunit epsilon [Lamprobacter modestohalophilus]|uniref:DNA polymerase III subunit epsilon n=1 Tax=Lamprobacter modestohalophilus TaxID=1064514 RepID=A0A9X1B5V8_9GAMM|nr:3'-5' exonuclease [Lamprobacter modestohalophilus]MBK1620042.1 DNA polymerase III subunit epsilon [Lamprobacter modestohalophilus]MCF7978474.1 3'-5' exonuclease [Chromatiaceae bacterium]MCF7996458.1 3'-5' exonuclease [Chromatiaceae bacterium]MCF8004666.1 3'-5' exonuclease [Chromatiaceae bacterium]
MRSPSEGRRRHCLRQLDAGPLREYFGRPFPSPALDYRCVDYVALDLETTGLDHRQDQILSVGWVVIRGQRIDLASARHRLLRCEGDIPAETAVIHQITDDEAAAGLRQGRVLRELLGVLAGRVLIAHHAKIELSFLDAACRELYGGGLLVRCVDTEVLARRTFERRNIPFRPSELRLHALCERYNLPRYRAHNAFYDALAAAELFLAQVAYRDNGNGFRLGDLL